MVSNLGILFSNSHPFRSKAWPLPASKEQLDLPCSFVSFAKHWPVVCHQNILSLSMLSRGRSLAMPQPFRHEVYSNVLMKQNKKRFQGGKPHTSEAAHDVFIHCFHQFLQATIRIHWLILLASYLSSEQKHHEASMHPILIQSFTQSSCM